MKKNHDLWKEICIFRYEKHWTYKEIAEHFNLLSNYIRQVCRRDPRYNKNTNFKTDSKYAKSFKKQFEYFKRYCESDDNIKNFKPTYNDYMRYIREPSNMKKKYYYIDGYERLGMAIVYQASKDACVDIIENKKNPEDSEAYNFLLMGIADDMSKGLSQGIARKIKSNPKQVLEIIYSENNLFNKRS